MRTVLRETTLLFDTIVCFVKRNTQTRHIRLAVERGGRMTLTIPKRLSLVAAQHYFEKKKAWIVASYERSLAHPPRLLTQGGAEEYRVHKERARERITARVVYYAERYGVTYQSLSIRNQKSRFGSCSARRHLSFNYRLIFLPPHLLDYVVVHEVCHLQELNHSQKFWTLVAQTIPDYREHKQALQTFSRQIS
jgi:predicted metal-dependent hydrolase